MHVGTCPCSRVEDHLKKRAYYLIDEALTWYEARDRCSKNGEGYLAEAHNAEQFDFLRGMYDKYRAQGGNANGAWIDGQFDNGTKEWVCDSYIYGKNTDCMSAMPWTHGEPNNLDTERCALVWFTRTDGVANYMCHEKMPVICATYR